MNVALKFLCVWLPAAAIVTNAAVQNPAGFELFISQPVEITITSGTTSKADFYGFRQNPGETVALLLLQGETEVRAVPLKELSEPSNELLRDKETKVIAAQSKLERDLVLAIRAGEKMEDKKSAAQSAPSAQSAKWAKWLEETLTLITTAVTDRKPQPSGKGGNSYVSNREQNRLTELVIFNEKHRERIGSLAVLFGKAVKEIQQVARQGEEPEILARYLQRAEEFRVALKPVGRK